MRSLTLSVCLILFCFPVVGFAQQEPSEKPLGADTFSEMVPWPEEYDQGTLQPIRLLMTREEVHKMWGKPKRYLYSRIHLKFNASTTMYFSADMYEDISERFHPLIDVFYRETSPNRYEIRVQYKRDSTSESDSGRMRVSGVYFVPATPVPAFEVLKDIPEAAILCGSQCETYATSLTFDIVAYPRQPTERQRKLAHRLARLVRPGYYSSYGEEEDWRPVLELGVEMRADDPRGVYDVNWLASPVYGLDISVDHPLWTLEQDKRNSRYSPPHILPLKSFYPQTE